MALVPDRLSQRDSHQHLHRWNHPRANRWYHRASPCLWSRFSVVLSLQTTRTRTDPGDDEETMWCKIVAALSYRRRGARTSPKNQTSTSWGTHYFFWDARVACAHLKRERCEDWSLVFRILFLFFFFVSKTYGIIAKLFHRFWTKNKSNEWPTDTPRPRPCKWRNVDSGSLRFPEAAAYGAIAQR